MRVEAKIERAQVPDVRSRIIVTVSTLQLLDTRYAWSWKEIDNGHFSESGQMKIDEPTDISLCEIRIKSQEDNMGTWFRRLQAFLWESTAVLTLRCSSSSLILLRSIGIITVSHCWVVLLLVIIITFISLEIIDKNEEEG